jgi:hypothetical protein
MRAYVKVEYVVMCPVDAPKKEVSLLAKSMVESLKREYDLKEMGIDIDKLLEHLF